MISRRRWRGAFTLIEVLVVVAIIALLIAVLLPALSRAKEQSRRVVCMSQLRQQGFGFSAYANSNRNMFPCASKFRFSLMEQTNYTGQLLVPEYCGTNTAVWMGVNCGGLFPKYVGKTGFYLSAVDAELRHADDQPTIGLLLCKGAKKLIEEAHPLRALKEALTEGAEYLDPARSDVRAVEPEPDTISEIGEPGEHGKAHHPSEARP